MTALFRHGSGLNFDGALIRSTRHVPWRDYRTTHYTQAAAYLLPLLRDQFTTPFRSTWCRRLRHSESFPLTPNGKINRRALPLRNATE